ncbi:MAG TPA: hypothetical protein VEE86_01270 [Thermoplasmata archaeon]|nr:hypothetical protein [Thermoplasmata archaeon]
MTQGTLAFSRRPATVGRRGSPALVINPTVVVALVAAFVLDAVFVGWVSLPWGLGSLGSRAVGASPAGLPVYEPVVFTESGLRNGTTWSVTLAGSTESATVTQTVPPIGGGAAAGTTITFQEPAGTYPFRVGAVLGYGANPSSGTIVVSHAVSQAIVFTDVGIPGPGASGGHSGPTAYYLLGLLVGLVAVVLGVEIFLRSRSRRSPQRVEGWE